jgi:hypothetical protein
MITPLQDCTKGSKTGAHVGKKRILLNLWRSKPVCSKTICFTTRQNLLVFVNLFSTIQFFFFGSVELFSFPMFGTGNGNVTC